MEQGACFKAEFLKKSLHALCALLYVEPILNYAIDCFLFSNLLQDVLSLSHLLAAIMKHKLTTSDPFLIAQLNFMFIMKKKYMFYSRYWGFRFFNSLPL